MKGFSRKLAGSPSIVVAGVVLSLILIGFVFSYRFFDWSMAQTVNEGQNLGNRVVHLGRNLLFKIESGKNLQKFFVLSDRNICTAVPAPESFQRGRHALWPQVLARRLFSVRSAARRLAFVVLGSYLYVQKLHVRRHAERKRSEFEFWFSRYLPQRPCGK